MPKSADGQSQAWPKAVHPMHEKYHAGAHTVDPGQASPAIDMGDRKIPARPKTVQKHDGHGKVGRMTAHSTAASSE